MLRDARFTTSLFANEAKEADAPCSTPLRRQGADSLSAPRARSRVR